MQHNDFPSFEANENVDGTCNLFAEGKDYYIEIKGAESFSEAFNEFHELRAALPLYDDEAPEVFDHTEDITKEQIEITPALRQMARDLIKGTEESVGCDGFCIPGALEHRRRTADREVDPLKVDAIIEEFRVDDYLPHEDSVDEWAEWSCKNEDVLKKIIEMEHNGFELYNRAVTGEYSFLIFRQSLPTAEWPRWPEKAQWEL